MTPGELRTLGNQCPDGWQTWLAGRVRRDPRTIRRWLKSGLADAVMAKEVRRLLTQRAKARARRSPS